MLKNLFFVFMLGTGLIACNNASTAENHEEHDHETEGIPSPDGKHFGAMIDESGTIAFEDLMAKMNGVDSLPAKFVGTVAEVCQKKGCWMNVKSDKSGDEIFVQFKDYAFFMPKDIAGRKVTLDGYAYREVTSVDELRHYAEDEGKSKEEIEKITEPKEELKFLASGVILMD